MFYHKDVEQVEFPNLLTKAVTKRNKVALEEASVKGSQVIKEQVYEIVKSYECENTVIIEAVWKGILAVPLGTLKPGDQMTAYFAQFFEFKDGLIISQKNYDCFENFL